MRRALSSVLIFLLVTSPLFGKERFQHAGPIHLDHDGEKWAKKSLDKMSDEEKVGQLFMIWLRARFFNVNDPDFLASRTKLRWC